MDSSNVFTIWQQTLLTYGVGQVGQLILIDGREVQLPVAFTVQLSGTFHEHSKITTQ